MLNEKEENGEFLYLRGKEVFTKTFEKTIKAVNYINQKYTYNYLLTNICSFWNIHNLYKMAIDFTTEKCFTGVLTFNSFITGTGIIMSNDVCHTLAILKPFETDIEDVILSNILKTMYQILPINDNVMCRLTNDEKNVIPEKKDQFLYFRIKNQDRQQDIKLFKMLLHDLYDIHFPTTINPTLRVK